MRPQEVCAHGQTWGDCAPSYDIICCHIICCLACRDTVDKLRSFWYAYKGGASPQAPPGGLPQVCCCLRLDLQSFRQLGGLRRQRCLACSDAPVSHLCALRSPVEWLPRRTCPMQPPAAPGQAQPGSNGVCTHACCAARPFCIIDRLNDVKKVGKRWMEGRCQLRHSGSCLCSGAFSHASMQTPHPAPAHPILYCWALSCQPRCLQAYIASRNLDQFKIKAIDRSCHTLSSWPKPLRTPAVGRGGCCSRGGRGRAGCAKLPPVVEWQQLQVCAPCLHSCTLRHSAD